MALVKPSFSLQSGITLTNPAELEYYSGPWMGTTLDAAIQAAKDNIPNEYRYHGMKIKLLVVQSSQPLPSPPFYNSVNALNFTSCKAYTYWFNEGITNGNLVPFSPDKDAGVLGNAAGSTNEIQFNKNGVLSASSGLTFNPTKSALTSSYVVATVGFSGSLTQLADGTSYLREGTNISIVTGSKGEVTISSNGVAAAGSEGNVQFKQGTGLGADPNLTFGNGALTSSIFVATLGITGSLTQVSEGVPYLVASSSGNMSQVGGISISTGSNGQISASYYVYPDNITVYLKDNKYFGRYPSGFEIPAKGKTPAEVLKMAMFEPIPPTLTNQTENNQTVPYNQPTHSTVLRATFIKGSYGGSTQSQKFWWKRNGATNGTGGIYEELSSSINSDPPSDYIHNATNGSWSAGTLNENQITYKFDVLTSTGETSTSNEITVTMNPYAAPTAVLSKTSSGATIPQSSTAITTSGPRWALSASSAAVNAATFPFIPVSQQKNLNYPHFPQEESFNYRMKGNVSSSLGFSVTKNSPYVSLLNYSVNQSVNGGAESTILSSTSFGTNNESKILFNNLGNFLAPGISTSADSVTYKVYISDERYPTLTPLLTETISFDDVIYAGVWSYTTKFEDLTAEQKEHAIKSLTPYRYFANKIMAASKTFYVPIPLSVYPHRMLIAVPGNLKLNPSIDSSINYIMNASGGGPPGGGKWKIDSEMTITLKNKMLVNNSDTTVYTKTYKVYLNEVATEFTSPVIYKVDLLPDV